MGTTTWAKSVSTMAAAVLLGVLAAPRPASAQAIGYGIAGPAGYSGFFGSSSALALHAAGGGEVLAGGRVGGGGELGVLVGSGGGLFVASANGVFHVVPGTGAAGRAERVSPFISGGYTRWSNGEGEFDGWNAGAGADVWLKPRLGMRFEFRDHVRPDSRGTVHYWAFRAGVAFR
jgi:hypothetical protein